VVIGETFKDGRYTVLHKLGWGHFSTVWLVADSELGGVAALKVVKSAQHYTEAALDEIDILSHIAKLDPHNQSHCCRMLDTFKHRGPHGKHVCMVFELLGDNLLTLIRHYSHEGIPLTIVKHLTRCIMEALDYLHHKCGIIHTDLKPENVMLTGQLRKSRVESVSSAVEAFKADPAAWKHQNKGKLEIIQDMGKPLTKNQKKKLRKKLQKAQEKASKQQVDELPEKEKDGKEMVEESQDTKLDKIEQLEGKLEEVDLSVEDRLLTMDCKIVDFGNACWSHKHFTDDIQTRQYRAPEVNYFIIYRTLNWASWYLDCIPVYDYSHRYTWPIAARVACDD